LFPAPDCKDGYCPAIYKPYLAFADDNNGNAVGEEILYMAIDSLLYFFLIMLVEFGVFGILYEKVKKMLIGNEVDNQLLDDDVVHEQDRVDGQIKGQYTPLSFSVIAIFPFIKILNIGRKKSARILSQD
jgi:hypothetical protein